MIELTEAGIGVAAISYDSENTLALFAERRGITFPLLSDGKSAVIKEYGILNTVVGEGLGSNADDTDVVTRPRNEHEQQGGDAGARKRRRAWLLSLTGGSACSAAKYTNLKWPLGLKSIAPPPPPSSPSSCGT